MWLCFPCHLVENKYRTRFSCKTKTCLFLTGKPHEISRAIRLSKYLSITKWIVHLLSNSRVSCQQSVSQENYFTEIILEILKIFSTQLDADSRFLNDSRRGLYAFITWGISYRCRRVNNMESSNALWMRLFKIDDWNEDENSSLSKCEQLKLSHSVFWTHYTVYC